MLISLPIEIKVREFYNKLLLAYKVLDQTQHEILIGEKYKVYNIFKKNKNILLISKGGPEKNFFIKKKIANNKLMLLDEEGPVINFQNYVFENRISNKIFNIIDEYIFWGKKDYFYIKKKIKKTKIKVLGHPKFDTCKKPYIDIYKDEILKIKKKYKRFILFSSSFGTDTILKEKIYENFFFKNLQKDNKKNRNEISRDRDIEKKNYLDVINLIKVLAKLHPQINFIFRPHPRQNPEIIKKRFTSINNIKVIYKGTITPWIKACDLFMHSGCTSVLEAITMDKKIISFVSNKNEFRNNFYYKFGYHFNEEEILISNFLKILKKKKPLKKNVTPYVYNLKKKFFYDQFINYLKNSNFDISIKKINYEKERPNLFKNVLINLKSLFLKISFFDKFLFIFKTNFLLSNEYRKKKIEKITKKEIKDFLKKINNVLGKKNIFLISKLDANLFKISMK